jgi:hypothetical protein
MQAALFLVLQWLLREVVLKFLVLTAVFAAVAFFVPKALSYLSPWLGDASLTSAFAGIPSGVWFFLDAFRLDYGVPLMIAAFVARFLIRRLPVIGG